MEIEQESQLPEVQQVAQRHPQVDMKQGSASNRTKVSFPGNRRKRKVSKKPIIIVIVVILLGVLGYFIFRNQELVLSPEELTPTPTLTPAQERATPTPRPTLEPIDKDEIKIEVLNGTGIGGEAAFLQDELEELGYGDIEVGNADTQDNSKTEVIFGRSVANGVKEEITKLLKELYQKVSVSTSSLDEVDIQITAGLRKGQTLPTKALTATPTPSPAATTTITPTVTVAPTPTP